ncbi:hypothetical protein [Ruegeria sp. MALMAid1280]|uniref:hypothetical protein n=1 Tax=Ruegeria sp. MALMAid1280 TaxID=3411634 RepID=UPI003BA0BC5E
MFTSLLENGLSITKVADVLASCRKLIPTSGVEALDKQLQEHLERLALSAPHILADIGFEREVAACGPGVDVWRRQDACVIIQFSSTTSVSTL